MQNENVKKDASQDENSTETTTKAPLTIGEERVRIDFNVSGSGVVDEIKRKTAELITLCESLKPLDGRLASLAQTTYEEAAMWAVKAATTPAK